MSARKSNPGKLLLITACVSLSGCLDGGGESDDSNVVNPPPPPPTNTNNAPTISGNPAAAVTVGETYQFTPNASDADGDSLTFAIENKPRWAEFNTSTGALTGTPELGDIGAYANIGISVSDGNASTNLSAFSVDVTQVATGAVTLSWTPPTQNEDGSALTDLTAYRFYYGTTSGNYTNQVQVDNPGVTTYVVENLAPATYYFVATSINSMGIESRYSNEAIKQAQ